MMYLLRKKIQKRILGNKMCKAAVKGLNTEKYFMQIHEINREMVEYELNKKRV